MSPTPYGKMFNSIHGEKGCLFSRNLPKTSSSHWNTISTLNKPLSQININLQSFFVKKVADGMSTIFRRDVRIG